MWTKRAKAYLVERVGSDALGKSSKDELEKAWIDQGNVAVDPNTSSGVALSAVEDKAENMIIVIPGANGLAGQQEQEGLERVLGRTKVLLLH